MGYGADDGDFIFDMSSLVQDRLKKYDKILIIGPYPPPLGGVSVYIYRLSKSLDNSQVFDVSKNGFKKYIDLFVVLCRTKFRAVNIHSFSMTIVFVLMITRLFKNFDLIATSHNPRLFEESSQFKALIYRVFFHCIDVLVVVNKHILDDYKSRDLHIPKSIIIEHAFLPPPLEEEDKILATYPSSFYDFIKSKTQIITANAFQISFYKNTDLYGLDICIELTAKLKNVYPNLGFIFALANEKVNTEYIDKMRLRIKELNLEENFYFLTGQKELWPIFKKASLMIRPTNTDGDALSIREALYFKCPAIASDVCDRPKGTILFKNRNLDDLYDKTKGVLDAM